MRLTMKNRDGKVVGVWVAKTKRGFNAKQKQEILKARQYQARTELNSAKEAK